MSRNQKIGGALFIAVALAWFLWPTSLGNVRNLDSRGTGVIAFGDSLTAGYGAAPGDDYPSRLSKITGLTVQNAGVSGDTTESALARIDDVIARNPRIVIVGLGGNDFLRRMEISATEANLRTIVRRIQDAGAMVVLLGFRFPSISGNYEDMYERVAEEERAMLVEGTLKGILNNPSLKSDEIHPNGRGYELMATRIAEPLRKLMKKADGM
jgi:acyl-CoA thioesterase I